MAARSGFEVLFVPKIVGGHRLRGQTTAREDASLWSVSYDVDLDAAWRTRSAHARSESREGTREVILSRSPDGQWTVDGTRRPDLDGCVDIDFESSAVTNTLPIHRIDFVMGQAVDVPAAFVRPLDLRVGRLEQKYTFLGHSEQGYAFRYESSTFDFSCDLSYDNAGLIDSYPGIAVRVS